MLRGFIGTFLVLVFSLMLASCAGIHDKAQEYQVPVETSGLQKFSAWKQGALISGSIASNKAVLELLYQADESISRNELNQASDKLERLLRIEPASAQAWSRLAWISLEKNMLKRTQQMAQRSNSYAYDDKKLKILNWAFIREAALQSGDDAMVQRAEKTIESLQGSWGSF